MLESEWDVQYLVTSTEHGSYDELEERYGRRTLLMSHRNLVCATRLTLPYWRNASLYFPKIYRPLREIVRSIAFVHEHGEKIKDPKTARIPLDGKSLIVTRYNKQIIKVPVDDFIVAAVAHFAEDPVLDLRGWMGPWFWEFKKEWEDFVAEVSKQNAAA